MAHRLYAGCLEMACLCLVGVLLVLLHEAYLSSFVTVFLYGFGGVGQRTHGQDDRLRAPGSIGACAYPARVFPGTRMAGQMGGDRVTVQNLVVLKVIPEYNLIMVKGSVPGAKNSIVIINK